MHRLHHSATLPAGLAEPVVDAVFQIDCRSLPVDHAWPLSQAITRALPWFEQEELASIHSIYVGASGNGWLRPEDDSDLLHLPKRARLILRIPGSRFTDVIKLTGHKLDIGGHDLIAGTCSPKALKANASIISRQVVIQHGEDENLAIERISAEIETQGIVVNEMVCGKMNQIREKEHWLCTRSVMVTNLQLNDSVKLQQTGIGSHRILGCGIFIPCKI